MFRELNAQVFALLFYLWGAEYSLTIEAPAPSCEKEVVESDMLIRKFVVMSERMYQGVYKDQSVRISPEKDMEVIERRGYDKAGDLVQMVAVVITYRLYVDGVLVDCRKGVPTGALLVRVGDVCKMEVFHRDFVQEKPKVKT